MNVLVGKRRQGTRRKHRVHFECTRVSSSHILSRDRSKNARMVNTHVFHLQMFRTCACGATQALPSRECCGQNTSFAVSRLFKACACAEYASFLVSRTFQACTCGEYTSSMPPARGGIQILGTTYGRRPKKRTRSSAILSDMGADPTCRQPGAGSKSLARMIFKPLPSKPFVSPVLSGSGQFEVRVKLDSRRS